MSRLSAYHVRRPRLIAPLAEAQTAFLTAGGGYGKTALAAELAETLGCATVVVRFDDAVSAPAAVLAAHTRAFAQAGLGEVALALRGRREDDVEPLAALAETLALFPEPLLVVLDETQHVHGPAAEMLARLLDAWPRPHRAVVAARRLAPELAAAARAGATFGADELRFDERECAELITAVAPRRAGPSEVAALWRATHGWPAAVVFAATASSRSGAALHLGARGRAGVMRELVDVLLAPLGPDERAQLARLAQLPLVDAELAATVGPRALELATDVGLPLRPTRGPWLELPDPVREELASRAPPGESDGRRAAETYAARGELAVALAFLASAGDHAGLAALLGRRGWHELGALDVSELRAYLSLVPAPALEAEPAALVQVARAAERAGDYDYRTSLLDLAASLAGDRLLREVEAERALDAARNGLADDADAAASAVLAAAGADELVARARVLAARGRACAFRRDTASLLEAERALVESATLFGAACEREWRSEALLMLGFHVHYTRGDLDRALGRAGEALALVDPGTPDWAAVATIVAEVQSYCGLLDDATALLREAGEIGRTLGRHRVQAYVSWLQARVASFRGDAAAAVELLHGVERHPGSWFAHPTGIEFLAEAAEMLARLGDEERAREYVARAEARAEAIGHPEIAWGARGNVEARFGDPALADRLLVLYAGSPQQPPRDDWRTLLLRAQAGLRAGDGEAPRLAARAFSAASSLGYAELPLLQEPDVAVGLAKAAEAAGSPDARRVARREPRVAIAVLGTFTVSVDGRPLRIPPGGSSTLVKRVAVEGGLLADAAIEMLWPGVPPATGRGRLRNLLNRTRAASDGLVGREGEAIVLARPASVDAALFEAAAADALAATDPERASLARAALARYGGPLLPDDVYEEWTAGPRERLRRRYLELLDVLVEDAVERDAVDEAIRLLDRAIAEEPLDESRYLRAAELLLRQGRRGGARSLVDRAAATRDELRVPHSPRLLRLRQATGLLQPAE